MIIKKYADVIESQLFKNGPVVAFIWENIDNWPVLAVSKNITRILGYTIDDFLSHKISYDKLIHPDDLNQAEDEVSAALSSDDIISFEHKPYRVKKQDNSYIWVYDTTVKIFENQDVKYLVGYILDITDQKNLEIELKNLHDRWNFAVEGNGDGLWDWNIKTSEVYFSPQWKRMLGFNEDEIKATLEEWEKRVHPDDLSNVYSDIQSYFDGKTDCYENIHRVKCKDGSFKWILDRGVAISKDEQGKITRLIGTHRDVTENKILQDEKNYYLSLVNEHIITSSTNLDGIITEASKAFSKICGYAQEELIGRSHNIIRHSDMPKSLFVDLWERISSDKEWSGEIKNRKKDGSYYWVSVTILPRLDQDGKKIGYSSIRQDITDKKLIEELSIKDKLTNVYNRLKLDDVLFYELSQAKRYNLALSIILIDIDRFKSVNDNYGHQVGDTVLQEFANILVKNSRDTDTVGRWGGEEFLIIMPKTSLEDSKKVAEKIRKTVEEFDFSTVGYKTASFGVSSFSHEDDSEQRLIERADKGLYIAKENGRNRVITLE